MLNADAVRRARDLEQEKAEISKTLQELEAESLSAPEKPTYSFEPKERPPIKVHTDWKLALGPFAVSLVLLMLCSGFMVVLLPSNLIMLIVILVPLTAVWAVVYLALINKKRQKRQRSRLEASPEYQAQCAAIDAENTRAEAAAKGAYEAAMKRYTEELMPSYEARKAALEKKRSDGIASATKRMKDIDSGLSGLYAGAAAVEPDLRNAESLDSICRVMDNVPLCRDNPVKAIQECRKEQARKEERRQALLAEQQRQQEARAAYERQLREEARAEQRRGLVSDIAATAIGTSLGTRGAKKELRNQTRVMEQQTRIMKQEQKAREQQEWDEKMRRWHEESSQRVKEDRERKERRRQERDRIQSQRRR